MDINIGCLNLEISTWRPITNGLSSMRSKFIGGSSELEDIAYEAIPTGHTGSKLNKYGFKTETSGSISLRLNLVHQAR